MELLKLESPLDRCLVFAGTECPPISRTPDPYQQAKNVWQSFLFQTTRFACTNSLEGWQLLVRFSSGRLGCAT